MRGQRWNQFTERFRVRHQLPVSPCRHQLGRAPVAWLHDMRVVVLCQACLLACQPKVLMPSVSKRRTLAKHHAARKMPVSPMQAAPRRSFRSPVNGTSESCRSRSPASTVARYLIRAGCPLRGARSTVRDGEAEGSTVPPCRGKPAAYHPWRRLGQFGLRRAAQSAGPAVRNEVPSP